MKLLSFVIKLFRNNLFFHEIMHGVFAIPFALFLWGRTESTSVVLTVFIVAYLIDLDHFVDYFSVYGFKLNFSDFFRGEYFDKKEVAYIPLHAWEWFLILGVMVLVGNYGWDSYHVAILLGLLSHYILDSINVKSFLFYSISYRYLKYLVAKEKSI